MRARNIFFGFLFISAASPAFCQNAIADQPAFSSSPESLKAAFATFDPGSDATSILLEASRFELDDQGRVTTHRRVIFKVLTKAGAEGWANVEEQWAPWEEERPVLKARVIGADGTVRQLDPKTIADSPARNGDDQTLSDRRMIRAVFPGIEVGSIVEEEVTAKQTQLTLGIGTVQHVYFGNQVATQFTRVEIRAPENLPLRFHTHLLPDAKTQEHLIGRIREIVIEQGPMKANKRSPVLLPPDTPRSPTVEFTATRDWSTVATAYRAAVDRQLDGFKWSSFLPEFAPGATRDQKIETIVGKLNREIRYTGIEFAEASIVPRTPAEVIQRKYGDCKDKATLAVGMLRAAGIEAYVALLFASQGEDIDPELPGIGIFNHAIVYVPGSPDIWLDLTDPDLRVHVMSPENQNRFALVAAAKTTGLIHTPELPAEMNRVSEMREFQLSELGRAKVSEETATSGIADREYRAIFGGKDEKALRDQLKQYVDWTYGASKVTGITVGDADKLDQPFKLRIEMEDAQRGSTSRTEAAVGIFPAQLVQRLPVFFREEPKAAKKNDGAEPEPPRTQDFYVEGAFTHEIRYRILAPPGFRVRRVPDPVEEKLGPGLVKIGFASDGADKVTGTMSFTLPQRRFTAAEGLAMRDAVVEFSKRKALLVYFDQIGETDLAAGDIRGALREFGELRKQHPKEALHVSQNARALLAAGAGEAARAEARRAAEMEPDSPKAQIELADVLKHDLIGRLMEKGFDRDGAEKAYRRALEIDPDDVNTRANLAILLEYDASGNRYASGSKLAEAIEEYKKILDKLPAIQLAQNYSVALFQAGRMDDLRVYLRNQPDNDSNQALLVCTDAALNGSKAAIERAGGASGEGGKQRVLVSAAQSLIAVRRYELAADLLEAAAVGAPNPAAIANTVQVLRKTKRIDDDNVTGKEPEDTVRTLFSRVIRIEHHEKDWTETFSKDAFDFNDDVNLRELRRGVDFGRTRLKESGMSLEAAGDLMQSSIEFAREGSDNTGYVIRLNTPGNPALQNSAFFVTRQNGAWRIIGGFGELRGVGVEVLNRVAEGKLDAAKIWLDRVRQEVHSGNGDDPLSGPLFPRLWQLDQKSDAATMRHAAAALMLSGLKTSDNAIRILAEVRNGPDGGARDALSAALAEIWYLKGEYAKAAPVADEVLKKYPRSPVAFSLRLRIAYAMGGKAAADPVYAANVERFSQNADALRMAETAALVGGDHDRVAEIIKKLADSGRSQAEDYNNLAWSDLVAGKVTTSSIDAAKRALMLSDNKSTGVMHTLAALDAEVGKEGDARSLILQRMKAEEHSEPDDDEWYVFGRIAEQFGLKDEAAGMYKRLMRPTFELAIPDSSYGLSQRRLKAMAAAK
jgi:tetratricopeptide (TPR) repeat protein